LRDDGVDTDFPSREEIKGAQKNNKIASPDSIAAELLKNGEPNLVDALHEVIQQAWTSETLPRSWTEGVLCPMYKKGNDCSESFKTLQGLNRETYYLRCLSMSCWKLSYDGRTYKQHNI
jgi:hypothetical protein